MLLEEVHRHNYSHSHLQARVNAHVLQEGSLCDGSQAGHLISCNFPQVTEVHICCQVCHARCLQDIVELMAFKALPQK